MPKQNQPGQHTTNTPPGRGQKTPEQRRTDKEERSKKNVEMAAKPDARVMQVSTPYSDIIFQIHRQLDLVWKHMKAKSGEPTGISYEQLIEFSNKLQKHVVEFNELTREMAETVKWTYKTPFQLQPIINKVASDEANRKAASTPEKIHALPVQATAKNQASKPTKEKKAAMAVE